MRLCGTSGSVKILDAATGAAIGRAKLEIRGAHAQVAIPLGSAARPASLLAKLKEPSIFFDSAGWREIPTATSRVVSSYSRCFDPASNSF